ncbi:hypothetical protein Fot_04371 [Forsythia ovata]|uniref:Uncharacterized protein n=1 Tax=Forsythia ovata TaxID=205694 RepID=A0ABD1XCE0_9LAMI
MSTAEMYMTLVIHFHSLIFNMLFVVVKVNVEAHTVHKIREKAGTAFKSFKKWMAWLRENKKLLKKLNEVESRVEQQKAEAESNMRKLDEIVKSERARAEKVVESLDSEKARDDEVVEKWKTSPAFEAM